MDFLQRVLLLVVWCVCLPAVWCQPASLPGLPNQFYTFVTTNFLSGGFTESWEEWVDLANNKYRYDGRFSDPEVTQVLLGNELTVWSIAEQVPCTTVLLNNSQSWRFRPAYNWYFSAQLASGSTPVYTGISTAARGIPAYTWLSTTSFVRNTSSGWTFASNFTTTYYWSTEGAYYNSPVSVPIRIESAGATYNLTSNGWVKIQDIDNVVTFVAFRVVNSFAADTFQKPAVVCTSASSLPQIIRYPGPYNVQDPPPIGSVTIPHLPYDFSTQIEGRFSLTPTGGTTTTTIIAGEWSFYMPSYPNARLEKWEPAYYDDTTYSAVYNYTSVVGKDGNIYAGIQMTDNNGTCSAGLIDNQWDSPLCTNTACFLPELFTRETFLLDKVTYIGRQEADGVDCDVYQKQGIVFNMTADNGHSMSYQFTCNLFFYPQGWQIVGLEQSSGNFYSLPVLIQNTGTVYDLTAKTTFAYSDSWSFYILDDENPDMTVFNPSTACANAVVIPTMPPGGNPTDNSSSNDISSGAIAGAVIGAVAGAVLVAVFCYCFRRSFDEKKNSAGKLPAMTNGGTVVEEMESVPAGTGDRVRLHDEVA